MAEAVLYSVLNSEISVATLTDWLLHRNNEEAASKIKEFSCTQGDFILYFLNEIHEEAHFSDGAYETPRKKKNVDLQANNSITSSPSQSAGSSLVKSQTFPPYSNSSINGFDNVNNCSTPKLRKSDHEVSRLNELNCAQGNTSYMSPISPLYRNNASLMNSKNRTWNAKKSADKSSLCLGDFIVNSRKSSAKKRAQKCLTDRLSENVSSESSGKTRARRINPTNVNHKKMCPNFGKTENSFNFKDSVELPENLTQRNVLVEERLKVISRPISTNTIQIQRPRTFSTGKAEIIPELNLVTFKESLDILISIYVILLDYNLVLNVCSELHFLTSLLLCRQFGNTSFTLTDDNCDVFNGINTLNHSELSVEECDNIKFVLNLNGCAKIGKKLNLENIFSSIHNVVYFAIKVLESQLRVLEILDKDTLKLILNNRNVSTFSSNFHRTLSEIFESKDDKLFERRLSVSSETNVCFISDTDNRENFPNDPSFHAFRKQRDLFYEILRIWEKNRLQSDWNFAVALGGKIRALLSLHNNPVNFVHLARLFKAQLLTTCGKYVCDEALTEEHLPFLSSIPNVNMEKLSRLKNRLVTKQPTNILNAKPEFIGHQEFYKDFILVAVNNVFIKHLSDCLIHEIVEMNDSKFAPTDIEEEGTIVDAATQNSFSLCLKTLRILAKFLGFIESLPYKTETAPNESVLSTQISIRQTCHPNLHLLEIVSNSIKKRALIITIPWIVKYLSMLDYVTLRLPYYSSVIQMLFGIYQNVSNSSYICNRENTILIKFTLGWLFELQHFPDGLYYNYCSNKSPDFDFMNNGMMHEQTYMDHLQLVNEEILYMCCPYLKELKKLLISNSSNDGVTVRHITPLTAVHSPTKLAKRRLEMQLEESFFNGQPVSVKKTVEFVSERIASTCVKHICNNIVPNFKKHAVEEWKTILETLIPSTDEEKESKQYIKLMNIKSNELATTCLAKLKQLCKEEVSKILNERIPTSVGTLLSLDVLPQTKDACTTIATRFCNERIEEWMNSHIVTSIFSKDFDSEMHRALLNYVKKPKDKLVFVLPQGGRDVPHNSDTLSAVHLVESIRELMINTMERVHLINENSVVNLLDQCARTISERCDVNDCILNTINTMLVDLSLLLVVHHLPIILQESVVMRFTSIWKSYTGNKHSLFKSVICPRNVMLLAQSQNTSQAWNGFAKFVALLLKENVLTCESFEEQSVAIFKKEWDQKTLKRLSGFFNDVIKYYINHGGSTSKFTLMLNFLSEFCSDVDV